MKELMVAIKLHLQSDPNLNYIQPMSIFITLDERLIPNQIKLPAISIKDGPTKNKQKLCRNYLQFALINVTIYQRVFKPGELNTHGVLDMAADVIASLIGKKLLADIQDVFPIEEEETQIMGRENEMIQMKVISFLYTRHRTW